MHPCIRYALLYMCCIPDGVPDTAPRPATAELSAERNQIHLNTQLSAAAAVCMYLVQADQPRAYIIEPVAYQCITPVLGTAKLSIFPYCRCLKLIEPHRRHQHWVHCTASLPVVYTRSTRVTPTFARNDASFARRRDPCHIFALSPVARVM